MDSRGLFIFVFLIISVLFVPSINADVISVNSAGTGEIILNPDSYIEGFFSRVDFCGDSVVTDPNSYGVSEQCDDGNTASGDGCSATCQTEAVTPPAGDGGAAGGGGVAANIALTPSWDTEEGINLAIDTTRDETITVTNLGTSSVTVTLTHNFEDHLQVIGNTSLTISAGQSEVFNIRFIAGSEPGTVAGIITVSGVSILTSLDISTQLLLFDSNIVVLNEDYKVEQGDDLQTLVTLIPLGDPARLDVTLNYEIKDFSNKVYLTRSETLLIDELIELRRDFDTGTLPLGNYVVALELIYPNGVAPSSATFEVVEKTPLGIVARIMILLLILILIILIIIIILLIIRRLQERKQQTGSYFQ